jgi:hypothetical protein
LRREGKSVQAGFGSKPIEFEGFKIRIVKGFPDTQVFNGVAVSHPVGNDGSRVIAFKLGYIGQRDVIIPLARREYPISNAQYPISKCCACLASALTSGINEGNWPVRREEPSHCTYPRRSPHLDIGHWALDIGYSFLLLIKYFVFDTTLLDILVSDLQGFQKPYRSETKMSSSVI